MPTPVGVIEASCYLEPDGAQLIEQVRNSGFAGMDTNHLDDETPPSASVRFHLCELFTKLFKS